MKYQTIRAQPHSMESQSPTQSTSRYDSLLLLAAVIVLVGGMTAFYYFIDQVHSVVRLLGLLVAVGSALALVYQTELGRTLWSFITGARTELRKVVWPTRQETVQMTLMIAVVVVIMSLAIWLLDTLLLWAVKYLTGQG